MFFVPASPCSGSSVFFCSETNPSTAFHFQVAKHMLWPQERQTAQNVHFHLCVHDNAYKKSVHLKPTSYSP